MTYAIIVLGALAAVVLILRIVEFIRERNSGETRIDIRDDSLNSNTGTSSYNFNQYGYNDKLSKPKKSKKPFLIPAFIMIAVMAFLCLVVVLYKFNLINLDFASKFNHHEKEKLNEYSFEDYKLEDYSIEGDGIVYNDNGLKITVKNIYKDQKHYTTDNSNDFKIEFEVVNNSSKDYDISLGSSIVNNYGENSSYFYLSRVFKKHSTVTCYGSFLGSSMPDIKNITFDRFYAIDSKNNYLADNFKPVTITTTRNTDPSFDFSEVRLIYSNDDVEIYSAYNEELENSKDYDSNGYYFYIYNKTDKNYYVDKSDFTLNGLVYEVSGFYANYLPAHSVIETGKIYSSDDLFVDIKNKDFAISFKFDCDDQSHSFETEKLNLKDLYWE